MTTVLTQTRKRAALATGKPLLSYNHAQPASQRPDAIEIVLQADVQTPGGKGTYFTLSLPVDEFDRIARFAIDRRKPHVFERTQTAADNMATEMAKDMIMGLSEKEQIAKALDFATTMLKHYMPHCEQNDNSTLAYVVSTNDKAQGRV